MCLEAFVTTDSNSVALRLRHVFTSQLSYVAAAHVFTSQRICVTAAFVFPEVQIITVHLHKYINFNNSL